MGKARASVAHIYGASATATTWPPFGVVAPSWWRIWRASYGRDWHFEAYGAGGMETGEALSRAVAESRARRAMERLRDG